MMINLTPHAIVVRDGETEQVFSPSGTAARLKTETRPAVAGIDVVRTITVGVEGLPDPRPGICHPVSSLVAQVVRRPDLFAADTGPTAIRDSNGQIVAVTGFRPFA